MMEGMRRIPETMLYQRIFVGCITQIRRCCWLSGQCKRSVSSVVKTKSIVAKCRINESELKKNLKVMNLRIKSEGYTHYPVLSGVKVSKNIEAKLEMTSGVDLLLYSHRGHCMNKSTGSICRIISDIKASHLRTNYVIGGVLQFNWPCRCPSRRVPSETPQAVAGPALGTCLPRVVGLRLRQDACMADQIKFSDGRATNFLE
jgi:hypothetical protein